MCRDLIGGSDWSVKDESTHIMQRELFLLREPIRAQLFPELRNSPFSVICREEVLLGDKPFLWDVTA